MPGAPQAFLGHEDPARGGSAGHDHLLGVGFGEGLFSFRRREPDQQAAPARNGDRHVAVEQEREAAEHCLLAHRADRLAGEALTHAVREVFVVGHAPKA